MDDDDKPLIDRRTFLKKAAVTAGVAGAAPAMTLAQSVGSKQAPPANKAAAPPSTSAATATRPDKPLPGDIVIERPGSDFMMDVIKTLDLEYVATNPASSFRSLHE